MKHAKTALCASLTIFALAPLTAMAEGGFYLGGSVGSVSFTDNFDALGIDTDSTSYRLTAGLQLNDFFSVEGGYHNFGDFEQRFNVIGDPIDVRLKADGFTLGVTGSIPLGSGLSLFGRAGGFFWDGDTNLSNPSRIRPEDSNPYLGAGATVAFSEHLKLVGDWTRYEFEFTESDVISLGLTYRF
jgi:hypothetical protein